MLIAEDTIEHITERKLCRHWFEMSIAGDAGDGIIGLRAWVWLQPNKLINTPDTLDALWTKVLRLIQRKVTVLVMLFSMQD